MAKNPHVNAAEQYVRDVLAGKMPVSEWTRLACERHKHDKERAKAKDWPYKFDRERAERACRFMELFPHTKGKWAQKAEPFELQPWQCFFVASIFGWIRKDTGNRRFRRASLRVSRKNGKSDMAARIGLYMFAADGEFGAEVYSGATSQKQAWEVFRPAKQMVERTGDFREHFGAQANAQTLHILDNASRFEPVIGKPGDGASPSCAIVDEYHEHKTDELYDTMETGMGAREQGLMLIITTAGENLAGPCYEAELEEKKILQGVDTDEETFSLIYTLDDEDIEQDRWTALECIQKANPNFGVSVDRDYLLSRLDAAKRNPRKQAAFKTKHLNVWVGALNAWFDVNAWKRCADPELRLEDFEGQPCYVGLDLAHKRDVAALELLFPIDDERKYVRFGKYYLPDEAVEAPENEHYRRWMAEGWLTVTDGPVTDFNEIEKDLRHISDNYQLREVAFDPAQATQLMRNIEDEGIPCVQLKPTRLNFSEPMKELDALMHEGLIKHNRDPVMTWMVSNVVAKTNDMDEVYPKKDVEENKIDGVIANLMALNRALAGGEAKEIERGIITL